MKKVSAYLQGGLGNQAFIYAAARALALRTGSELSFCGDYFIEDNVYRRSLSLDAFNCAIGEIKTHGKIVRLTEKVRYRLFRDWVRQFGSYCCDRRPFKYRSMPHEWRGVLTLDGYWQSEKYFYDVRDQILTDFQLRDNEWLRSDVYAQKIVESENSVFLHVRSYKEVPGKEGGECAMQMMGYYLTALECLKVAIGRGMVFVFSDDIEWVKTCFLKYWVNKFIQFEFVPVDGESSQIRDFTLMRMCRHGIVADSSFSWWAGWLGEQERIAKGEESLRFHVNRRVMNDDFWPERWISIKG